MASITLLVVNGCEQMTIGSYQVFGILDYNCLSSGWAVKRWECTHTIGKNRTSSYLSWPSEVSYGYLYILENDPFSYISSIQKITEHDHTVGSCHCYDMLTPFTNVLHVATYTPSTLSLAHAPSSVVHTGVKSAGWEKRTPHEEPR